MECKIDPYCIGKDCDKNQQQICKYRIKALKQRFNKEILKKTLIEINSIASGIKTKPQKEYNCIECNSLIPYKNFSKIVKHKKQHEQLKRLNSKLKTNYKEMV